MFLKKFLKTLHVSANMAILRFCEIKMNHHAFMSINRMKAAHSSLKASLSRFNIVSTMECKCGDGLQTEDHSLWNCKLYEDQGATMVDILSEKSKTEYPKPVTKPLRLVEDKRFVQSVCYFIENS
jgi:hypothetical protein